MEARMHWRLMLWPIRRRRWCLTDISNLSSHIAISLAQYLCDLAVGGPQDMPTNREKWEMVEKLIRKGMHRMRGRLLRAYIDAMSADSSFSVLTKACQRIRSINMRKNPISSAFFVFFDRTLALRGRGVVWLHSTLSRSRIMWFHVVLVIV